MKFLYRGDEKVLKINSSDGFITLWMYLMPLNYTLQVAYMVNFILCILYYIKKIKTDTMSQKHKNWHGHRGTCIYGEESSLEML